MLWPVVAGLDEGLGYTGCSAGISSLGEVAPDSSRRDFSDEIWQPGLRLFPGVTFGPHWDMLDTYLPGLRSIISEAIPDDQTLFAVDERTAAVGNGSTWSVIGLGKVHVRRAGEWQAWGAGETFTAPLLEPA